MYEQKTTQKFFMCKKNKNLNKQIKTFESLVSAKGCAKKWGHVNESDRLLLAC